MNAREILNFLNEIDAFRRPEKLKTLMQQVEYFLEFHGKEEKERFEIFESVYEFISGKIEYGDLKKLEVGEIKNRVDFRNTPTFTIDPVDAKDYDDALSVKNLKNGNWEIGIHIADVSYYVKENSIIDTKQVSENIGEKLLSAIFLRPSSI